MVGGSLTGLVAARVLADHFRDVVLVERDRFPDGPDARKGVPQARHLHVLLKGGERILRHYFPGLREELLQDGASLLDMAGDTRWRFFGGWKRRFRSGLEVLSQSRALLEWKVRRRVASWPGVRIHDGAAASGIAVAADRVCGLELDGGETLAADLVVDASGRGSRMPQWLQWHGYRPPEETDVGVDVGYASRFYRRPRGTPADWQALMIYPRRGGTRLGVLFPAEGERWTVTLVGWFGDHPGSEDAAFIDFARSLDAPDLFDAVRAAEPCSPIAIHRFPSNRRRHYERCARLPAGLAVLGDAFCSFNPIYGQGMTTGALGARTLDACLAAGRADVGERFHRRLARVIDSPWLLTTTEDLRSADATGVRPAWMPLAHWYTERVHRLTWSDAFTARRFLRVMHMTAPPRALLHPWIICRALALAATPPSDRGDADVRLAVA